MQKTKPTIHYYSAQSLRQQSRLVSPSLQRDILQWDVTNWACALDLWSSLLPASLANQQALELGAAGGGLSLFLALKQAQVICSDLQNPGPRARPLHQRYGLNINYQALSATDLPFADKSLDLVCFKSVLGGIRKGASQDPKPLIMQEILRVLRPGGYLLLAENLAASPLHAWMRQIAVPWSSGWEYLAREELLSLLAGFEAVHYTTGGLTALLGRKHWQRQLLGKWDQHVMPFVPSEWHYIFAGLAQKSLAD